MLRGLELLWCGERLRELEVFSLEKRRSWETSLWPSRTQRKKNRESDKGRKEGE